MSIILVEYFIASYFILLILSLLWKIIILDLNLSLLATNSSEVANIVTFLSSRKDNEGTTEFNQLRVIVKEMTRCYSLSLQSTHLKQLWIYNVMKQIYFAYRFRKLAKTEFQAFFNSHYPYQLRDTEGGGLAEV